MITSVVGYKRYPSPKVNRISPRSLSQNIYPVSLVVALGVVGL
jgi:hypothetical protein